MKVVRETDVSNLPEGTLRTLTRGNESLTDREHLDTCPVHHGASIDCVWPVAVCVPFKEPDLEDPYARINVRCQPPGVEAKRIWRRAYGQILSDLSTQPYREKLADRIAAFCCREVVNALDRQKAAGDIHDDYYYPDDKDLY